MSYLLIIPISNNIFYIQGLRRKKRLKFYHIHIPIHHHSHRPPPYRYQSPIKSTKPTSYIDHQKTTPYKSTHHQIQKRNKKEKKIKEGNAPPTPQTQTPTNNHAPPIPPNPNAPNPLLPNLQTAIAAYPLLPTPLARHPLARPSPQQPKTHRPDNRRRAVGPHPRTPLRAGGQRRKGDVLPHRIADSGPGGRIA